jgi:hypothetical protein
MRLALLLFAVATAPAAAQRLAPEAPRPVPTFQYRPTSRTPSLAGPGDHAWEGAKAGGLILGIGGLGAGYAWCSQGDSGHPTNFGYCAPRALLGGLMGATIGSIIGGFIGSGFPKSPNTPPPQ